MPNPRKYKDFPLILQEYNEQDNTFEVSMPPTEMWGEPDPITIKYNYDEIETSLRDLEADDIEPEALIELGKVLADFLLAKGILRENFVQAVKAAKKNDGVRLRLTVRDSAKPLQRLPWEYIYLQIVKGDENHNHFLSLNPKISLVRHPALDCPVESLEVVDRKQIRLLAVTANPKAPGLDPLDIETENKVISQALKGFNIDGLKLEWKPINNDITEAELNKLLMQKPELFHFSGHGVFDEGEPEASLVLVKDKNTNTPSYLGASVLSKKLQAAGVRMAYLGTCKSSTLAGASQWSAIAPALIAHMVPAVVAMQYMVLDGAAREFSHAFYLALAAGFSVDEAVSYGRLAVLGISEENGIQWGIPTLYLRAKDGQLFPELSERKTEAAKYIQNTVKATIKEISDGAEATGIKFPRDQKSGKYIYDFKIGVVKGKDTKFTIVDFAKD